MVGIIVNLSLCSDLRWYKTSCRATFLRFQNLHSKTNRKVSEFLLGPMEDQGEKKTQQTTCRSFRLLMYSLMMSWPQKLFFVLCFVWDAYSYTIIPGLLHPKVGITGFKKAAFHQHSLYPNFSDFMPHKYYTVIGASSHPLRFQKSPWRRSTG